jgi:hypothetical protein
MPAFVRFLIVHVTEWITKFTLTTPFGSRCGCSYYLLHIAFNVFRLWNFSVDFKGLIGTLEWLGLGNGYR